MYIHIYKCMCVYISDSVRIFECVFSCVFMCLINSVHVSDLRDVTWVAIRLVHPTLHSSDGEEGARQDRPELLVDHGEDFKLLAGEQHTHKDVFGTSDE